MPSGPRTVKVSSHAALTPFPTVRDTGLNPGHISSSKEDLRASASGKRSRSSSNAQTSTSRRNTQSIHTNPPSAKPGHLFPHMHNNPTILVPHCGLDTIALIFIFSTLPTWISSIVLGSYILLGSFKSLASKTVAKWLFDFDQSVEYSLETSSTRKNKFYKSELIGLFLQLFSINSFILLIFQYTLPSAWTYYLTIMAKTIVASRLVGTYTTGSTTYVSVVSNTPNVGTTITTTTTTTTTSSTNSGTSSSPNSPLKADHQYSTNSFLNSLTICATVLALDYFISNVLLSWNATSSTNSLFFLILTLLRGNSTNLSQTFNVLVRNVFFITPGNSETVKLTLPYGPGKNSSSNPTPLTKCFLFIMSHLFQLSDTQINSLAQFFKDLRVVSDYAYLVLCIHVISLTIAPFLGKIFILKDYLRTLDQLSALTPDIPFGGLKKSGIVSGVTRDTTSNAVVVINVELTQQNSNSASQDLKVIEIIPSEYRNCDLKRVDSLHDVSAENFKNFCLVPPTNKTSSVGTRTNHSKTIMDRKKTATNSIPSTTIMDKYFTISIQPLWSWLAALRIISLDPVLFAGSKSNLGNSCDTHPRSIAVKELRCSIMLVDESHVVFQAIDSPTNFDDISVTVNGLSWDFIDVFKTASDVDGSDNTFISVFCLSPLSQYKISIFIAGAFAGSHSVSTRSSDHSNFLKETVVSSQIDTLTASLSTTVTELNDFKSRVKKAKKDENKRMADLRKQLEMLKSKFDKYQSSESSDARFSSKLKGLQNSVSQLEIEINELEQELRTMESPQSKIDEDYTIQEQELLAQIEDLEKYIAEHEAGTSKMKHDAKAVEGDKAATETKLKKLESKLESKREEIQRLTAEIKSLKKSLIQKIQKKQKNVHERYELIIPQILEAANQLNDQKAELQ